MENLTVRELHANLAYAIKEGLGNKKIYIASDEEGNCFNPLFFGITSEKSEIDAFKRMGCISLLDKDNIEDEVLLG